MGLDLGARWVPPLRAGHPDRNESVERTTNSRTHGGIVGRSWQRPGGPAFGWVRPGSDQFSKRMQALSATPFFLDLRDPAVKNDVAFVGNQSLWVESRSVALPLIQNTDAIVWLKRVHPPELRLPVLLIVGGMHYRATLVASASLLVGLGLSAVAWRRRKRSSSAKLT